MISFKKIHYQHRKKKISYKINKRLSGCPQKKAVCIRLRYINPKKPNSAVRKGVKVRFSNKLKALVAIPGHSHNLTAYSRILVRAGRANDLPGVHYKAIKGVYDFSWIESLRRGQKRSKFGVPKPVKEKLTREEIFAREPKLKEMSDRMLERAERIRRGEESISMFYFY